MKKLKIAQIGVRHEHAQGKILTIRNQMSDVFEVAAIAGETAKDLADHDNDPAYDLIPRMTQDELLAIPDLDAVFVETEMSELVPTARRCLERGLPMHIDKPAGSETLEPYIELVRDCEKAGVLLQPGYMFRGSHYFQFLNKAVRSGWLGEIMSIDANMNRHDLNPEFRAWLSNYKGGGLFDFGSHIIDAALTFMGEPETITSFQKQTGPDNLYDNGLAVITWSKAIGTFRCSQQCHHASAGRRMTVRGTKGILEISPIEQGYFSYPKCNDTPVDIFMNIQDDNAEYKAGAHHIRLAPMNDRYEDQLRDFVKIVRGEMKNPFTPDYEIMVQKVVLAASGYISWR